MSLPKIDLPLYEVELPSTGEKIKYRPFTVKEEKVLLIAQESNEPEQELLAVKQIVNNCIMDKDVSELAMFDLEYIMLMIRGRSVDNEIRFQVKDPDTEEYVELELDLNNIKIVKDEGHTNKIRINEQYVLFLKYPSIDDFIKIITMNPKDPLVNYFIMTACLDKIVSEDEVHSFKDYSEQEVDEFMEGMTGEVIKGIQQFFETMPRMRHELKYTNKNGKEQTYVLEGMRSFFI